MMKPLYIRIVSIILVLLLLIGVTQLYDRNACSQVVDVATNFSQALIERDKKQLLSLSSGSFNASNTKSYFSRWNYKDTFGEDKAEVLEFIQSSLTFEVRRGTADASTRDKKGEIDVYFSMVDYDHVYSEPSNLLNGGMILRELRGEDQVKTFRVTLNLVLENDGWRVSNLVDAYNAVYSFLDIRVPTPHPVWRAVLGGEWYYATDSGEDTETYYENASVIDMDLVCDPDISDVDYSGVYYTVSIDDELVFTSENGLLEGFYGEEQEAEINDDGYLISGEYTIAFYDSDDSLLYEGTARVAVV